VFVLVLVLDCRWSVADGGGSMHREVRSAARSCAPMQILAYM